MKRRDFITFVGGAAVAVPIMARAQERRRVRRIGVIMIYAETDPEGQRRLSALMDRLHKLGWMEGSNIKIDVRWAAGKTDRICPGRRPRGQRFCQQLFAARRKHHWLHRF